MRGRGLTAVEVVLRGDAAVVVFRAGDLGLQILVPDGAVVVPVVLRPVMLRMGGILGGRRIVARRRRRRRRRMAVRGMLRMGCAGIRRLPLRNR